MLVCDSAGYGFSLLNLGFAIAPDLICQGFTSSLSGPCRWLLECLVYVRFGVSSEERFPPAQRCLSSIVCDHLRVGSGACRFVHSGVKSHASLAAERVHIFEVVLLAGLRPGAFLYA
ncbi:hypothetical protein NDN08_007332 [Rhodosorus marinus]|uniref:Uncharacterized protein n=1 Tax=Rhodosorus marinus TaxID=101924 RepID=A0AAV8UJ64_9RHOD|nr:hypothetical protein NDN08_007332 [Rhodosorus marinus]